MEILRKLEVNGRCGGDEKTNYHIETVVYNKLITLSNGLMFIASTTTGIIEVYSRTKLHVYR